LGEVKIFNFTRKNGDYFQVVIAIFILIMKTPENQPKCHSRRCDEQPLVIYRRHWFCVVHALATARIRQFIRSLRGGE
jgi:hypothetical protein